MTTSARTYTKLRDSINPGSFAGPASQVETKTNQRVWDKFQGKFEGR